MAKSLDEITEIKNARRTALKTVSFEELYNIVTLSIETLHGTPVTIENEIVKGIRLGSPHPVQVKIDDLESLAEAYFSIDLPSTFAGQEKSERTRFSIQEAEQISKAMSTIYTMLSGKSMLQLAAEYELLDIYSQMINAREIATDAAASNYILEYICEVDNHLKIMERARELDNNEKGLVEKTRSELAARKTQIEGKITEAQKLAKEIESAYSAYTEASASASADLRKHLDTNAQDGMKKSQERLANAIREYASIERHLAGQISLIERYSNSIGVEHVPEEEIPYVLGSMEKAELGKLASKLRARTEKTTSKLANELEMLIGEAYILAYSTSTACKTSENYRQATKTGTVEEIVESMKEAEKGFSTTDEQQWIQVNVDLKPEALRNAAENLYAALKAVYAATSQFPEQFVQISAALARCNGAKIIMPEKEKAYELAAREIIRTRPKYEMPLTEALKA